MYTGSNKHIPRWVTAFLILTLLAQQSNIESSWKTAGRIHVKFTTLVVNVDFIPVTALLLIFLYCCHLLIDGVLHRDAEKLLLWLIGSALFNAFLVYDVLTSQLVFGNVTASVLILVWTSVFVIYREFSKDQIDVKPGLV